MDRVEEFLLPASHNVGYVQNTRTPSAFGYLDIPIPTNQEPAEIPDFVMTHLTQYVRQSITKLSFTLTPSSNTTYRRLVRGAVSDFRRASIARNIAQVEMSSGDKYYGIPGIIFDSNFNILLMMTSTVGITFNSTSARFLSSSIAVKVLKHTCRISPEVFQHQDRIIEKTIIKKVIPFCSSHKGEVTDYIMFPEEWCEGIEGQSISVVIEDLNNLPATMPRIRRITAPSVADMEGDAIHKLLLENINKVVSDN